MQLSRYKTKHIYCVEGDWAPDFRNKISIKTALDFLDVNANVRNIHKYCSSSEQMNSLIKEFALQRYSRYGILYFAYHGGKNCLHLGKRKKLYLEDLGEIIDGCAYKKIIHFGSCSTLNVDRWAIKRFMRKTGAIAVSGYSKDIPFIDSTLLDILFFEACQHYQKMKPIEKYMKENHSGMMKNTGFKFICDP